MDWIDLQTGYKLGAFRETAEMDRARQQAEAEGREVVYAQCRAGVREQAAQWWALRSMDDPDRFLDYTFSPARRPCLTAKQSLGTVVKLLYGERQAQYKYIVIVKL